MTPTVFATFKYQHAERASLSQKRLWLIGIGVVLALVALLIVNNYTVGIVLLLMALSAGLTAQRQLLLGPRYLLCGKQIVYYGNVKRLALARAAGLLKVYSHNGQVFVLERDKFPTGARKADKISKNKAAKFDKVSDKIIEKVRQAAPDADLTGV